MAVHTRRETTIRRVEHILPVPAVGADMYKALLAAQLEYREVHGVATDKSLHDNALTITITDDAVIISFEVAS